MAIVDQPTRRVRAITREGIIGILPVPPARVLAEGRESRTLIVAHVGGDVLAVLEHVGTPSPNEGVACALATKTFRSWA